MIEDKLGVDQRIRLEALAQSISANAMQRATTEKILDDAKKFDKWIAEGN